MVWIAARARAHWAVSAARASAHRGVAKEPPRDALALHALDDEPSRIEAVPRARRDDERRRDADRRRRGQQRRLHVHLGALRARIAPLLLEDQPSHGAIRALEVDGARDARGAGRETLEPRHVAAERPRERAPDGGLVVGHYSTATTGLPAASSWWRYSQMPKPTRRGAVGRLVRPAREPLVDEGAARGADVGDPLDVTGSVKHRPSLSCTSRWVDALGERVVGELGRHVPRPDARRTPPSHTQPRCRSPRVRAEPDAPEVERLVDVDGEPAPHPRPAPAARPPGPVAVAERGDHRWDAVDLQPARSSAGLLEVALADRARGGDGLRRPWSGAAVPSVPIAGDSASKRRSSATCTSAIGLGGRARTAGGHLAVEGQPPRARGLEHLVGDRTDDEGRVDDVGLLLAARYSPSSPPGARPTSRPPSRPRSGGCRSA